MSPSTADFTIAQLQAFIATEGRLRPAGLRARVDALDTGEVIAVYRPRDPTEWHWSIGPTEGDRVVVTVLPSGAERELHSIEAALDWIAAEELGGAAAPSVWA